MKLTDSGRFAFSKDHELLTRTLNKTNGLVQIKVDEEKVSRASKTPSMDSLVSSISGSFFSSPRDQNDDPQLHIKKVDLTLQEFDLHRYLIDLFTECKPYRLGYLKVINSCNNLIK